MFYRTKKSKIWEGVRICLDANSKFYKNFLFIYLVSFDRFIISFIIRSLILEERIHLCLKQILSFKKVGKSTRTRHEFNQSIYLTNFYIHYRLFNLFLDDFLDLSKYSFLKSLKNYHISIFIINFSRNKNSSKWLYLSDYSYLLVLSSIVTATLKKKYLHDNGIYYELFCFYLNFSL